jgi:transposase
MIAVPGNVRVWLATGHTDMRRGFPSLARLVQESLKRKHPVNNAAREALGGMVGPRLMTKADLL